MSGVCRMLSFWFLLQSILFVHCLDTLPADFGLNLGSLAAARLLRNMAKFSINKLDPIQLDVRNDDYPLFGPVAVIETRTGVTLGPMNVHFNNDMVNADFSDFSVHTTFDMSLLTLPFLGDSAHVDISVSRAHLILDLKSGNVSIDECVVDIKSLNIHLDRTILLNPFLYIFSYVAPKSAISNQVCSALSDALLDMQSRVSIGIPFVSVIPPKFIPYLVSPNIYLYARAESLLADNELLTVNVAIDFKVNNATNTDVLKEHSAFFEENSSESSFVESDSEFLSSVNSHPPLKNSSKSFEHTFSQPLPSIVEESIELPSERLHVWVEDRFLNGLLNQFRWNFKLIQERISLSDPKIPNETREFLRTLCEQCRVLVNVSADGVPSINVDNTSIVIEIFHRVALAVENPQTKKTTTGIDLSVNLILALTPTIENGVFRTRLELLHREILIQNGTAAPRGFFQPLSEMLMKTISEDIWPALQKGLEPFIYNEGVMIPPRCGIRPVSAELHFNAGRIGASAALDLDNLSIDHCVQHLRSELPSFDKLLVIETGTSTASPFSKPRKRW